MPRVDAPLLRVLTGARDRPDAAGATAICPASADGTTPSILAVPGVRVSGATMVDWRGTWIKRWQVTFSH